MTSSLSSGSAVAHPLPALVRRSLSLRCVATSPRTADAARRPGLLVEPSGSIEREPGLEDGALPPDR